MHLARIGPVVLGVAVLQIFGLAVTSGPGVAKGAQRTMNDSASAPAQPGVPLRLAPYPHGMKIILPGHGDLGWVRWMTPEGMWVGGKSHCVGQWTKAKQRRGTWTYHGGISGCRLDITWRAYPTYAETEVVYTNNGTELLSGVGATMCTDFVNHQWFYSKDARTRTFVLVNGRLTPLMGTDRKRSLGQEMPVYAVHGRPGPPGWRPRVDNGYGWGLSDTALSDGAVCVRSLDGAWVLGTFSTDAYKVSFNTKGDHIHGCIHSEPYLGELPVGQVRASLTRTYLMQGTPEVFFDAHRQALPDMQRRVKDRAARTSPTGRGTER